ncbi:hypothetical protein V2A60_001848 [Cordyceps javanica]
MRSESLGENLVKNAEWGAIPFDHYVLEHWNYELPHVNDGTQWRRLVAEYLASSPEIRQPYKDKAKSVRQDGLVDDAQSLLTKSNIERVLRPFQSIRERNLSQLGSPGDPIWITACYKESLHQKYCDLEWRCEVGGDGVDVEMVLSDADVYNINDDSEALRERITERLPGLFDHDSALSSAQPGRQGASSEPESLSTLSDRMETLLYIADEESVLENLVKVFWFDRCGQILLLSKIEPRELEGMTAMFSDGYTMAEAVEEKCFDGKDDSVPKSRSGSKRKGKKNSKSRNKPVKEGSDAEWETESEYGSN